MRSLILGIGSDILWVERLRRSLRRFGPGYLEEVFSFEELEASPPFGDAAEFYARAFCAKEACAKALGTGIADDVDWYDIQVIQRPGTTLLVLHEGALRHLLSMVPNGSDFTIHVDIGSRKGLAFAFVVIEIL
ncbi:holo-ACP synthase [Novosphingobium sp. 1949]|uniref:Holo-[acyl-carrier-protein] synthase n=1 Tax=Novosphingobium organovorum TaxID=2930092 RepID=A0ABT0BFF4_9SPHN|nr:holo-ACP synthase [Novosphingobium organovorum]MCJ2183698.1 holo-ACP synthase [Novosphingobium organovorum]